MPAFLNLERIDGELEVGWTRLTALELVSPESVGYFSLYQNDDMVTLDLGDLTTIQEGLDVTDNPLLPTCELEALVDQALSPMASVHYNGNADDGCPSVP